jgi:hypothetical protein
MYLSSLKNTVGAILVGTHIVAIGLCFLWLDSRLKDDDFRLTILILSPVTTVYALAYAKDLFRDIFQEPTNIGTDRKVKTSVSIFSILMSTMFAIGIIYTIYNFKESASITQDTFKYRLALIETSLGAFLGLIVDTLFSADG